MIRTKVTLLYLVLVGALVGVVLLLSQSAMTSGLRAESEGAMRRGASVVELAARLDEASLLAKAESVGAGQSLYDAMLGEKVVPGSEEPNEEGESLTFDEKRHLAVHEKLLAQKYRLDDIAKEAGNARNAQLEPLARRPHSLDIFMALDTKGIGVAELGKDRYSWFGADISEQFPDLKKLGLGIGRARVEYWMWSFSPSDEKRLYRVAIAPIRPSEKDDAMGVVVLGTMINDGGAEAKRNLLAGLSEEAKKGEVPDTVPHVVFLRGKTIVGSSFSSENEPAIAAALVSADGALSGDITTIHEVTVGEDSHLLMVRPVMGEGDSAIRVAIMQSVTETLKPLGILRANILFVGVAILLIGLGLLFFVVMSYVRRLEEVESGIQEVIAGNKDYVWEAVPGHMLQASMAHALNLMSAYLQGNAMPDDDGKGGGWDSMDEPSEVVGKPSIQGVSMPMMQAKPPKSTDSDE